MKDRVLWWLLGSSAIYFVAAVVNLFFPYSTLMYIQMAWILSMAAPLYIRPVARLLGMKTLWER